VLLLGQPSLQLGKELISGHATWLIRHEFLYQQTWLDLAELSKLIECEGLEDNKRVQRLFMVPCLSALV